MAGIRKVEDIEAWQEARAICSMVYRLTNEGAWARDFGLRDQVRRASVSIACNIAEGFARETDAEFARFLAIARGSATEVKTQIYIAKDLGYIGADEFESTYGQIDRVCRMITGLMDYLRSRPSGPTTDNRRPTTRRTS